MDLPERLRTKKAFWTIVLVLILIFLITPPGQTMVRAGFLTTEVIPGFPIKPLKYLTADPIVEEVKFSKESEEFVADIYRPNDKDKHPAMVFSMGALATRENPLASGTAESLARIGFVVVIPEEPDLAAGHVIDPAIEYYVSMFEYLYEQPYVDKGRVGFGGFCVGGSLAIIAAEDLRIAEKVSFIHAISPYYNLEELSREIITRQYIKNDERIEWDPAGFSEDTLKKGVVLFFTDEQDRKILDKAIFARKSLEPGDLGGLSEQGRKVLIYMQTQDYDKSKELYPQNWPEKGKELDAKLSPSTNIANLKANLFILSDTNDVFVPPYHSEKFVKNLTEGQVHQSQTDALEHVRPESRLKLLRAFHQVGKLYSHIWHFLNFIGS